MTPKNIQLDIWQFVRIMVAAENTPNGSILLQTYRDVWQHIDTTLTETANQDMEKYAKMMMETQVTLEGGTRKIANAIVAMAGEVIRQLTDAMPHITDETVLQDYVFEIHGLQQLIDEIHT